LTSFANKPGVDAPRKRELDPHLVSSRRNGDLIGELFVSLLTKLRLALHEKPKDIVVTSLDMEAGKSTIAANLAIVAAQNGSRTVLIDGDIRRGVQHNAFMRKKTPGLSECLSGSVSRPEGIASITQDTHVPNLSLISSGANHPSPASLLSSDRIVKLKRALDQSYDVKILDTPPLGAGTDAVLVHELFSGYVIVAKAGKTNIMDLNKKVAEFGPLKKKILGVVLNQGRIDRKLNYYYYPGT
jgi:capsular exopolysaccharide synthesis family protein